LQDGFGHLAATGVARAKNQDKRECRFVHTGTIMQDWATWKVLRRAPLAGKSDE
jgi:hypothetical protein